MLYLYIYLAIAIPIAMFACFWAGQQNDYDDAVTGIIVAALWPALLVGFLIWLPFGFMYWLGGKLR